MPLGFVLMILTGMQIRYVGLIDVVSFRTAVSVHNFVGFVLIANFFLWLVFYLLFRPDQGLSLGTEPARSISSAASGRSITTPSASSGAIPIRFTSTIYRKFNPLQSMIYQIIMMLLFPVQIYTGILLWDVKRFSAQVDFFGGVRVIDTVHVLIFIAFVFYILVHVYLGTLGHTRHGALQGDDDRLRGRGRGGGRGGALKRAPAGSSGLRCVRDIGRSPSCSVSRTRIAYFFISAWKFGRCMPVSSALLVTFQSLRLSASSTNCFSISSTDFSRAAFLTRLSSSPVRGTARSACGCEGSMMLTRWAWRMTLSLVRIAARCMTFSSSRTLPGQP